jgi:ribosome-binding factor A
MARSYRKERLNESIKELLGELILSRIKDPRVGFVTITGVEVARDLVSAKVYFTVMGGESEREESKQGLESAKNFLRKTIARELKLRNAPDFRFVYDDSLDRSVQIEDALKRINENDEEGRS